MGLAIYLFKGAVSLPGLSIKFLLQQGMLNERGTPELYAPGEEA